MLNKFFLLSIILSLFVVSGYSNAGQVEKPAVSMSSSTSGELVEFALVLNKEPDSGWFLVPYRDDLKVTLGSSGFKMKGKRSKSPPPFAGQWHGALEPPDNPVYSYYRSELTLGRDGSAIFIEYRFETAEGVDRTTEAGKDAPFDKKLVLELAGRWVRHRKREGKAVLELRVLRQDDVNVKWWNSLENLSEKAEQ